MPVGNVGQQGEDVEVCTGGDGVDAAIAQEELTDAGVIAAETDDGISRLLGERIIRPDGAAGAHPVVAVIQGTIEHAAAKVIELDVLITGENRIAETVGDV